MSTRFKKPQASYIALYELKIEVCQALGLDPEKDRVQSVLIEAGGFTVTTEDHKRYELPTINCKVEDWKAL